MFIPEKKENEEHINISHNWNELFLFRNINLSSPRLKLIFLMAKEVIHIFFYKKIMYSIRLFQQNEWDCKYNVFCFTLQKVALEIGKDILRKNIVTSRLRYQFLCLRSLVMLSRKLLRSMNDFFETNIRNFCEITRKGLANSEVRHL